MLGWPDLILSEHRVPKWYSELINTDIVSHYYWESEDDEILFQVNMMPVWHACVYAVRYRICTGWHVFRLYRDMGLLRSEARRLAGFFRADWFLTLEGRRRFRARHPECASISWRMIHSEGFPYELGMKL
jgi:hypothetical protein